jgi:rhamnosyltransferase
MNYAIIVPTFNGGEQWQRAARALRTQIPTPKRILVVDSQSSDNTVAVAREMGFEVSSVSQNAFDHGKTRQDAVDSLTDVEVVVFLTQDAVLQSPHSAATLVDALACEKVAAAYGRQVPRTGANPIESYARLFNYPDQSQLRDKNSITEFGLRTAFCSNSFAAWRVAALKEIGGFADKTIFAEDMHAAARLILAGYRVAYVAQAVCEHSHNYSFAEEFRRSFDIGVFHSTNDWLMSDFGRAEGEGLKFVCSEMKYVSRKNPVYLPLVFSSTLAKVLGYFLGKRFNHLPRRFCRRMSYNRNYWG